MAETVRDRTIASIGDAIKVTMDAYIGKENKPDGTFDIYVEFGGSAYQLGNTAAMGADVDAAGLARRIFNKINEVDSDLQKARRSLSSNETDAIKLRKKLGAPFEYQQEMAEKYGELKRLEAELEAEGKATQVPKTALVINADGTANVVDSGGASLSRADKPTKARPRSDVQSIADTIKSKWSNAPEIVVASSMDDAAIPQSVRDHDQTQRSLGAKGNPEGFFYGGKVYLIADQLGSISDVARVLFHETLGHAGLRGVFGDSLNGILSQIVNMRRSEVAAKAKQYGLDMNKPAEALQAAEEVLAEMAQTKPEMGFVKRAIAAIRTWLRQNVPGFNNMRLSDNELIRNYILPARKFVEQGKDPSGPGKNGLAYSLAKENALKELSAADGLFENVKSTAQAVADIARDNESEKTGKISVRTSKLPGLETMHTLTFGDGTIVRFTERLPSPLGQHTQAYGSTYDEKENSYTFIQGRPGENPDDVPSTTDLWIDISKNDPGKHGAIAYNIASTYAHNNGMIFIGDPSGLSPMALVRRTEQMISSALKFGTTAHIAPHPDQTKGDSAAGVPALKWIYGDHEGNFQRMIDVSMKTLENQFPNVAYIPTFEPDTGHFLGAHGNVVQRSSIAYHAAAPRFKVARKADLAAASAGWRTLARYSVYRGLGGRNGKEGSSTLDRLRDTLPRLERDGATGSTFPSEERIFYSRGADSLNDPDIRFSRTLGETLTTATNNFVVPDVGKKFGNRLADFRGIALQALGRRQLVDIYGKDLPQLAAYSDMVAQMDADKNEAGAEADALATEWGNLDESPLGGLAKHPGMERKLAELMHDATLAQIDPDKDFVDGDSQEQYNALRHRFEQLSTKAQEAYRKARGMYADHNEKVQQAIRERIERSELSPAKRKALLERMDGEFFQKVKGVYFPLARFGQYLTIVKDSDGTVLNVSRSETLNEADETRKILLREYPESGDFKVGKVLKEKEFNAARDGVGRGFMADLFETLDKTNAGEELIDSISQLYLAALPDLSWAKHGIHRKGTPGFSQDARRAFAQNMFHGARYLAKLRYADQLQTHLDGMQEHIGAKSDDAGFDSVKAQQVADEMVKRHDSMMNPESHPISTALTSFGFVFHLGLSPASAMVNLSQTALVALPVMGAKWGFGKSSAALLSASKQAASNRNDISKILKGDELRAYNEAVRSGVIDVTMAHDLAGIAQGEDSKVSAKIRPVMKWASFLFHHAEKFNRQVTFVAAYRLAREAGAEHAKAYADAVKVTYDGHFDYSASNRARLLQGNWQKVILLFKQYAQNMIYTLSRQAYQAAKAGTPQERKEARKALSGLLVAHAMAAGVLGLPVVGMLLSAASMVGGDDDEPWDAKVALQNMLSDTLGQKPAEVVAHGLSRLTPWDISGRVGLDKLLLPDIQEGLSGTPAAQAMLASAAGPVAGIGVNMVKGLAEMGEGHYQRGLESMMPTALRGPLKAYRFAAEGNVDKTGVPLNDEVSVAGIAGQALGLSPSETRLAQEGKSAIYSAERAVQARRSDLMRAYSMAAIDSDAEGVAEVKEKIANFNEKNPQSRIMPMQLMASVRARKKRIEESKQGVYLPKKRQDAMEAGRFAVVD